MLVLVRLYFRIFLLSLICTEDINFKKGTEILLGVNIFSFIS